MANPNIGNANVVHSDTGDANEALLNSPDGEFASQNQPKNYVQNMGLDGFGPEID